MSPGITVQHTSLPYRQPGLVRCDIAAFIGFIPPGRWPEGASRGDFLALSLQRVEELRLHPRKALFSGPSRRAVVSFFENGGELCHLFGVCISGVEDLLVQAGFEGALAPLLERLRGDEEISLIAVPDVAYLPFGVDRLGKVTCGAEVVWETLLAHCREMGNRFLLLDVPRGLHEAGLIGWFEAFSRRSPENRPFGALYYPWLHKGDEIFPPSGAVAGVFARTEREHEPFGVVWPPGNVQIRGATHAEVDLEWGETTELSELGVNPLVAQPGRGVVVWGARTLSKDPTWRYINSRRVVSMICEQIRRDNEWAVFEQNDHRIWKVLERDVGIRLKEFWRAGLITGESRTGDYEVKCDAETNPPLVREAGKLNVRVRLRPIGTVEHITIDLRLGESVKEGGLHV